MIARIALAAAAVIASQAAQADVESAFKLCIALDRTGLLSAKCSVSGWNSSVDISVDMDSNEARKLCGQMPSVAHQVGLTFDSGWSMRIYSPYSGENTIAVCDLR